MGNNYGCSCLRRDITVNCEYVTGMKQEPIHNVCNKSPNNKSQSEVTDLEKAKSKKNDSIILEQIKPECKQISESENSFPALHEKVINIINKIGPFVLTEKEMNQISQKNFTKKGPIQIENNMVYTGTWNDKGEKEGYGEILFSDGGKFEGFFKNDMMNGRGRLINSQGDYYEGEFLNDKANNFGRYVSAEGVEYIGGWKDDKQHGKGEETYIDGSKYIGFFEFGEKNGKGLFNWPDGSSFEGNFTKNTINGKGTYKWKDGRVYQGDWVNNKMEGCGIFIWPDNKKYVGQYKDDKKYGFGIFVWPDGKRYKGFWQNGKQNGFGIMTANGETRIGEWKNGQKTRWFEDNKENENFIKKISKKINDAAEMLKFNENLSIKIVDS